MAFMGYIVGEELCSSRKSVVTSQSSRGAVELRPYKPLIKSLLQLPIYHTKKLFS